MKNKYRMGQKVKVQPSRYHIGDCPIGIIIGIEKSQGEAYLGFFDFKGFIKSLDCYRYKVAYEQCNRFCSNWYCEQDIERK